MHNSVFNVSRSVRRRISRTASVTAFAMLGAGMMLTTPSPVFAGTPKPAPQDQMPLPVKLPKAAFAGTPSNKTAGPNVEKPLGHPRPVPMVPKGTTNLALHKKATSSNKPFTNSLDLITDGDREVRDDSAVELKPRVQWVQIDLGEASPLYYILIWHFHGEPIVFHDVVVQVSNDPNFIEGVTTLFNNDITNQVGQGIGKDREYFETNEGKLVDAKGTQARYVRMYSRGSTYHDPLNRYTEVEVYGLPSK